MSFTIATPTIDSTLNIALDTLQRKKQALIFVSSKRAAEKTAEDISKKIKILALQELSNDVLQALSRPTQQCERLARCVLRGVAFHHAGLDSKQKQLIEDNFRKGSISIICCTPTLAAGLNLPAFRAIIRDLKRYEGHFGMRYIPVLEYLQMAGRCGRPGFDSYGEAIVIAETDVEKRELTDQYLYGVPEDIQSKLNVEPVMRTYLLSLIATNIFQTEGEILDFFKDTFWAHQYGDLPQLEQTIMKTLSVLVKWEFLQHVENTYRATMLGKRVSELYLDPLTARHFVVGLKRSSGIVLKPFSFIQLIAHTLEMRPLLTVKSKEFSDIQAITVQYDTYLLDREPSMFDLEYEDWLRSIKTSMLFLDWMDEKTEDVILEKYGVRPGELHVKLDNADWLLYCVSELAILLNVQNILTALSKVRYQIRYGVKEELLSLLKLEGIGRVRARLLFNKGIQKPSDLKNVDPSTIVTLLGKKVAESVLKQVGHERTQNEGRLSDFVQ